MSDDRQGLCSFCDSEALGGMGGRITYTDGRRVLVRVAYCHAHLEDAAAVFKGDPANRYTRPKGVIWEPER